MPVFSGSGQWVRAEGPTLNLRVGVSGFAEEALRKARRTVPTPIEAPALIDTGSGRSIIQREVAQKLKLTPVGAVEIDTPSSIDLRAVEYFVKFWFDERTAFEVKVLEAPLPVPRIRSLVGRDVLAHGRFVYDGPKAEFSLTF